MRIVPDAVALRSKESKVIVVVVIVIVVDVVVVIVVIVVVVVVFVVVALLFLLFPSSAFSSAEIDANLDIYRPRVIDYPSFKEIIQNS